MASRVAIDIGGTFTDLVHLDAGADEAGLGKVSTTPGRFEDGVMEALEGASLDGVEFLVHGTRGFRDVLEIGKGNRADLYNLEFRKPEPFVPRRLRLEVAERVDHAGDVLEPLDEDGVRSAVARAREFGAEAIAVCFLHSYANPAHELRAGELIAEAWAGLPVTPSHRIVAEWREYHRSSTAVLDASRWSFRSVTGDGWSGSLSRRHTGPRSAARTPARGRPTRQSSTRRGRSSRA